MESTERATRVAAVADLHCRKNSQGAFQPLFQEVARTADVLALCGDLTDHGLVEEAQVLAREITAAVKIPVVAVLGNHDHETDNQVEITNVLGEAGVTLLDGEACEVRGISFAYPYVSLYCL